MSSWAEATYVINKLNNSLTIALNLDEDLQNIEKANQDVQDLQSASTGYNNRINTIEENIHSLSGNAEDFNSFIEESKSADFSLLGDRIGALEDSLEDAEHQIAFIDRKLEGYNIPATEETTSTFSIWLIEED